VTSLAGAEEIKILPCLFQRRYIIICHLHYICGPCRRCLLCIFVVRVLFNIVFESINSTYYTCLKNTNSIAIIYRANLYKWVINDIWFARSWFYKSVSGEVEGVLYYTLNLSCVVYLHNYLLKKNVKLLQS